MASFDYQVNVDNRSATYPSWPLLFVEMEANMGTIDQYADLANERVIEIVRVESPNFGRAIYLSQITLTPAPTALAPVRVYIDPFNRQAFVDPNNAHAQAGQYLTNVIHPSSRFFDLMPGKLQRIQFLNVPSSEGFIFGVRWRKAYV